MSLKPLIYIDKKSCFLRATSKLERLFGVDHGVRFKLPLTPFDFAQGRLREALGEREFESLNCRF